MSEQNTDREKLAELVENARMPMGGTLLGSRVQFEAVADAILASEWLREHDTAVWNAGYAVATRHMREPSDWARIRERNTE